MKKEIEKKFLIKDANHFEQLIAEIINGGGKKLESKKIIQAYMSIDEKNLSCWRVRITEKSKNGVSDIKANWTFKIATGSAELRGEEEGDMPFDQANALISATNRVIQKTRHVFEYRGSILEIDEFEKSLSGLYLLEIEKQSVDDFLKLELPRCIEPTSDVTSLEMYRNDFLSRLAEQYAEKNSKKAFKI